jgi:hypothetical protein
MATTENQTGVANVDQKSLYRRSRSHRFPCLAGGDLKTLREMARLAADDYAKQNPRFDRARFMTACGV